MHKLIYISFFFGWADHFIDFRKIVALRIVNYWRGKLLKERARKTITMGHTSERMHDNFSFYYVVTHYKTFVTIKV